MLMRRAILAIVGVWVGSLSGCAGRQVPEPSEAVDRFVEGELARQRIPGLAIAVLRRGEPIKVEAYGLANVEHNVRVTEHTVFQSGSVGKQFTAAGILLLAEDGRLRLNDPISTFLPEAPDTWRDITIRHLLTHTSGIPNYSSNTIDYRKDYTDDDLVAFAAAQPLDFPPGERWSYSNTGYQLLGIITTRIAGKFYGDFLAERVFEPLGMETARVISEAAIVPNRADGYRLADGELENQEWVSPSLNTTADGSLYLSALDFIAWERALAGSGFLSPESRREWWTPVHLNGGDTYPYGLGWSVDYYRGHLTIAHSGSWQGFESHIGRYTEDSLTVVVLANLARSRPALIAHGIAGLYDRDLQPPHLLDATIEAQEDAARQGERVADALRRFLRHFGAAADPDTTLMTPAFAMNAASSLQEEAAALAEHTNALVFMGCDDVRGRSIQRNGARIERYCYLRKDSPPDRRIATFWVSASDRVAGFDSYQY